MKLSKAVKAHLAEAEENAGKAFGDIQCAWDCMSGKAQESELGEQVEDLLDKAETLSNEIAGLVTEE